jgi:Leucine-rich repeat (LRR) protein
MKTTLFKTAHRWATARVAPTVLRFPFTVLLIAAAMAGCEKSDNNDPDTPTGPGITFTAVPDSYHDNKISFYATAQQLVVDWGDGSEPETYTNVYYDNSGSYSTGDQISHTYAEGSATYTVHIKEEGLTYFISGYYNQLTVLDVSGCTSLESLDCYNNQLTSLNVSGCSALQHLNCESNQLTALNVSGCTALQTLVCAYNRLTALDVSQCPALTYLNCSSNQLTSLDVTKCPALQELWCHGNQLTALNVSGCTALTYLHCYNNQLTSLDVSQCTALQDLSCSDNKLTSLNVSGCTALQTLYCNDNHLTATALNTVFTALPNRTEIVVIGNISVRNNPGAATCDKVIAAIKGWIDSDWVDWI